MKLRLSLYQKSFIWLAAPILFQIVMFACYSQLTDRIREAERQQYNSRALVGQTNWLITLMVNEVFSCFAYGQSGDADYLQAYKSGEPKIIDLLSQLAQLCAEQPKEQAIVHELQQDWAQVSSICEESLRLRQDGKSSEALAKLSGPIYKNRWAGIMKARHDLLSYDGDEFVGAAKILALNERVQQQQLLEFALVMNIAFALFLLLGFNRQIARRLSVLRDNTMRLATGQSLNPPLIGDDEISELDKTFHHMSMALNEARHREQAIVENAVDVICSINKKGVITAVSASSLRSWGYESASLIGSKISSLLEPAGRALAVEAFERATNETTPFSLETKIKHADGRILVIHWTGTWSETEQSLFCVARDITERKQLDDLKQRFVAMISHDLRTPLTALSGFLELVQMGRYGQQEKLLKGATMSKRSVDRLVSLVNDLLDLEKLQDGLVTLEKMNITAQRVLSETIDAVQVVAAQHKITLVASEADFELTVDADRIVQVMVNLVGNAIKFSPEGETVIIGCEREETSTLFYVQDHGRGIPAEHIDRVFDRFHQVETSDGKRGAGSGLGLAICKALVEQHHGQIGVESEVGKGSKFWFRIPNSDSEPRTIYAPDTKAIKTAQASG